MAETRAVTDFIISAIFFLSSRYIELNSFSHTQRSTFQEKFWFVDFLNSIERISFRDHLQVGLVARRRVLRCENNSKSLFEERLKWWCRKSKKTMTAIRHTHNSERDSKKLNGIREKEREKDGK